MSTSVTGTRHLLRLILRRDRVRLPVWIVGLGGLIAISAFAVPPVYDTPEKIAGYAAVVGTSAVGYLMSGRQVALDTIGGIVANEISQVAQLGICLLVMFLVVRHTRAEEESGRAELLRSTVVGRHAATAAALAYGVTGALLIGSIASGSMIATGLEVVGSVTYGVGLTLLGVCFVAVALVAAQLSSTARGALGLAGAAVALAYLVRGVGAMRDSALVWASPFGWAQSMDAFGDERWWPAMLLLASTFALLAAAAWLTAHRDFGGGLLQPRAGHARASRFLATPLGLAVRLQRGLLLGWAVGLAALGLLYGAVVPTIPDLVASNPDIAEVIGVDAGAEQALVEAFLGYVHVFMAVISTGFAVASVLRLHAEEESGRADVVLATHVSRRTWVGSAVLVSGVGSVLMAVVMGAGLAVGYGLGMGEWDQALGQVAAQASYVPAVLVVAALAVAVLGLIPRWSFLAWAGLAFVIVQVMLGETLRLPGWMDAISPFWHLPGVPVETFDPLPAAVELVLAVGLVSWGVRGFRRRDLASV